MYKGLKRELEEIVDNLKVGDGIVIEYPDDYYKVDRVIGYVYAKTDSYLRLTKDRNHKFALEGICNWWESLDLYLYDRMDNIRVVDPVNNDTK